MLDLLDLKFWLLSNEQLIFRVTNIADLLAVHPAFPLPWPDVVKPPSALKQAVADFRERVNAAGKGDRDCISLRNQAREELITSITIVGQYLVMVAVKKNDFSILENTGFRLKTRRASRTLAVEPQSQAIITSVKQGKKSGTVIVRARSHSGRVSYVIAICKGDPADESAWEILGHYIRCKNEFSGFEPASKLAFRLRYDINGNLSDWSAPVSIIVT